jgi:predicted Zn-dependent protease with MMP-like domain
MAKAEVREACLALPAHLHQQARGIALTLEDRPGPSLMVDGVEPDTLGLFVGDAWEDAGSSGSPLPPQIILFLGNLWEFADADDAEFRREVRRTYLHELGHFLGLDEDDLDLRGLE